MKVSISLVFKFHYIEDSKIVKLENFLLENKLILERVDFLKLKYKYKEYVVDKDTTLEMIEDAKINSRFSTLFFEDNSKEIKKLLKFLSENNFVYNREFSLFDFPILEFNESDYKDCEYFKIYLDLNQSVIHHQKLRVNLPYIKKTLKTTKLARNFPITTNEEEIILFSNIMEDFILQKFYVSYSNLFFTNKSFGELLLNYRFTGFDLIPVKSIRDNKKIFCYQLKNINLIEAPRIKTQLSKLFIVNHFAQPAKSSKYHPYYKKCNDIQIYEEEYIRKNFKDINLTYSSIFINGKNFVTSSALIISRQVYEILKSMDFEFLMEPIYSTKNRKAEEFKIFKPLENFVLSNT